MRTASTASPHTTATMMSSVEGESDSLQTKLVHSVVALSGRVGCVGRVFFEVGGIFVVVVVVVVTGLVPGFGILVEQFFPLNPSVHWHFHSHFSLKAVGQFATQVPPF